MFGKALKNVNRALTKAAKPAPRKQLADLARLDAASAALRKSPPKMPFGGAKMPPRFKPNMPMVPDLSKRPPIPATAASVLRSIGKTTLANPARSMMKKGGAVKKAAAKGKK